MKIKLLACLFVISLTLESDVSAKEVSFNFRNIGTFATGLSYGHLTAVINFANVKAAHKNLIIFLKNAHEKEHKPEKRRFYLLAISSMQTGTRSLERLEKAFFTPTRQKRQILAIASGFGSILSLGLSIYNTIQLTKLQNQVDGMTEGFEKVLHVFREENAAINVLHSNIEHVKNAILDLVREENKQKIELEFIGNQILLMTLLEKHNAELSSWGRGVEALLFGNLDPTLLDSTSLQQALSQLDVSVKEYGLKRLHSDFSSIYKSDISYVATSDFKITIFVHVPLVHRDPINLLEYVPVPFIHDELMLTIESPKEILATDKSGEVGLELTKTDLLHCRVENTRSGNTYVCPNTNLMRSNIQETCLGSLYMGSVQTLRKKCSHFVKRIEDDEEFAIQTGTNKFLIFAKDNQTIVKGCSNGTHLLTGKRGLKEIIVEPHCHVTTGQHYFWPQLKFDISGDFIAKTTEIDINEIWGQSPRETVSEAYTELNKISPMPKRDLNDLKNWIAFNKQSSMHSAMSFGVSVPALVLGLIVFTVIAFVFCAYKKANRSQPF